jgi:hypothetical protein
MIFKMIFQHVNFTFSQFFISLFWGLFNDVKALPGFFLCIFSSLICLKKPVFSKGDLLRWKVPARGDLLQWKKVPGGSGKKVPISVNIMLNQQ